MTTYTIESGFGDQIAAGIQSETEAARHAQRIADRTGRTVYWGEDREGGEMREVNPTVSAENSARILRGDPRSGSWARQSRD